MRLTVLLFLVGCAGSSSDPAVDNDWDGFAVGEDCNDDDGSSFPGANEFCDGVDNDCDGDIDEEALGTPTWRRDADGDGYHDPAGTGVVACEGPEGHTVVGGDCDDDDPDVHPGVADRCDGLDNDCDGQTDEEPAQLQYEDLDEDGYGVAGTGLLDCPGEPNRAALDGDCDDGDDTRHPNASELCNGIDDDCDGLVDDDDEPVDPVEWFPDLDGDGYGAETPLMACDPGAQWVAIAGDCLDTDPAVSPDGVEICANLIDDDCDGLVDGDDICV